MSSVTRDDQVLITQGHLQGSTAIVRHVGTASGDMNFAVIEVEGDTSGFFDNGKHWLPTDHMMRDPDFIDD